MEPESKAAKEGFDKAYLPLKAGILEKTPHRRITTPESVAAGILAILTAPGTTTGHVFAHEGSTTTSI